jgi:hypothetical protein
VDVEKLIKENSLRLKELNSPYDPVSGLGSPIPRKELSFINVDGSEKKMMLPVEMFSHELVRAIEKHKDVRILIKSMYGKYDNANARKFIKHFIKVRFKYDFEYWAFHCGIIKDKATSKDIKFIMNQPQRKVHEIVHKTLFSNKPGRFRILKARKWGGSTYVELCFSWIQTEIKTGWNSCIVTEVENQARGLRSMVSKCAKNYPKEFGTVTLRPFEGSSKTKVMVETGAIIEIGSMQKPDSLRSGTTYLEHLSEVGLWKKTLGKEPKDLIQTLIEMVMPEPWTCIFEESTAKGTGNYFEQAWNASLTGVSNYIPIFIAWFEDERNIIPIKDYKEFIKDMTDYDHFLFEKGATLEGINWYKNRLKEYLGDHWRMMAENPSDPSEAFQSTGHRAFAPLYVQRAKRFNTEPFLKGEIFANANSGKEALKNIEFQPTANGNLWVWALPDKSINVINRYVVPVDIGGRSDKADYSIIRVIDRYPMLEGGVPEAILTWKGHHDQDLVIWKAAQIAKYYNDALLIPESNSLDIEENSEGGQLLTLLDELSGVYRNIFCRTNPEKIREGVPLLYGFHTNKSTKPMIITLLNKALREQGYIEYDARVCSEYNTYEIKPNGSYGAADSSKDDLVMATAIGIWAATSYMPLPKLVEQRKKSKITSVSEASI